MVSVEEASRIIFSTSVQIQSEEVLLHDAGGRVLAESIAADRPFPPFDRVAMDGIAIAFADFEKGIRTFAIRGVQAAGQPSLKLDAPGATLEVMTGAVLPHGADTVIRYEDVQLSDGKATITIVDITSGQNVHRLGIDARQGELLLHPGTRISPAEVALLASVGKHSVRVRSMPSAAVISTGDELVAVSEQPLPHQLRRSNVYAIASAMREVQWLATIHHIRDDRSVLEQELRDLLKKNDVLILSGGVSKGKFDFLPAALETIGVKRLFHRVSQRPGKPFWFGAAPGKVVFALPGNPVSTFMCYYRYILPWLLRNAGISNPLQYASLGKSVSFQAPMTYFIQVSAANANGRLVAHPVPGGGSGDFANLKDVTGFLELPADRANFEAGEVFPYYAFRP